MNNKLLTLLAAASALFHGITHAAPQNAPPADLEDFALAEDRGQVVERFLPGTESRWYYGALLALQQGRFAEFDRLAAEWSASGQALPLLARLRLRRELVGFDADPERAWKFWIRHLGLSFDHRPPGAAAETEWPTAIAAGALEDSAFLARSVGTGAGFGSFSQAGLLAVDAAALSPEQLARWLEELQWPSYPGLAEWVVHDLRAKRNSRFGSRAIHRRLTLGQLDEVRAAWPEVAESAEFRDTYEARLAPSPDEWAEPGNAAEEAHLQRLEEFVKSLPAGDPTRRARVLRKRLVHDAARGVFDEAVLVDYLELPHLAERTHPQRLVGISGPDERIAPVDGEPELVRELLLQALRGRKDPGPYGGLLEPNYLVRLLAEANLLAGSADLADWQARLGEPQFLLDLERRVEVRFPASRPREFRRDETLAFDVQLKNVPTLHVKVYRLDPLTRFAGGAGEFRADLDLDGLVPHFERRLDFDEPQIVRHTERLLFPECAEPGWYAIELLGNGVASRVLAQKGALAADVRLSAAGHVVRVVNETGMHLADARVWLDGTEFVPDRAGEVLVPFASDRAARHLVLSHGALAQRVPFDHRGEEYELTLGAHVERETLLPGARAALLLRPALRVHGAPASLALLEDPAIEIVTVRHDGVRSMRRTEKPALRSDREFVAEFEVPANLAAVEVRLLGHVRRLVDGERQSLVGAAPRFELNRCVARGDVGSVLLGREGAAHFAELVGRNGEPLAARKVSAHLRHRDFPTPLTFQLASDARGRVQLGDLSSIASVTFGVADLGSYNFVLDTGAAPWPPRVHGAAGSAVRLPLPLDFESRANDLVLLARGAGSGFVRDESPRARFEAGALVVEGLPAGDYDLAVPTLGLSTLVAIGDGTKIEAHVQNEARRLQLAAAPLPTIRRFDAESEAVVLEVADAGPDTRVHLVARRRVGVYDGRASLAGPEAPPLDAESTPRGDAQYLLERRLSDEERYILERRFATAFLGNPLERAGLLLQPWSADATTSTEIGMGGGGGGGVRGGRRSGRVKTGGPSAADGAQASSGALDADLDFLPSPAVVLANLQLDANGSLRVPLAELGVPSRGLHHLEAIVVHTRGALSAEHILPEAAFEPRDRRLDVALDPTVPVHQVRAVEFVRAGETLRLDPEQPANHALYGSLKDVFDLYEVLGGDREFSKFRFLVDWPSHDRARKLELYSEFACHELHVFLHEKDPQFFAEVVRPYLANKGQTTFLDDWLLGRDLTPYLETRRMRALNTAEQVLLLRRTGRDLGDFAGELERRSEAEPGDEDLRRLRFETALARASLEPSAATSLGESSDFFLGQGGHRGPGDTAAPSGGPATRGPTRQSGARGITEDAERSAETETLADEVVEFVDPTIEEDMPFDMPGNASPEIGLAADLERRATAPRLYRELGPTRVLRETHWWKRPLAAGSPRTNALRFWRDLAIADPDLPFHSPYFVDATSSAGEMLLALAFLDLGFAQDAAAVNSAEGEAPTADRDLLLLRRELVPLAPGSSNLAVAADLFDPAAATSGGAAPAPVDGQQLVAGVPYGMRVVLSNPSNEPRSAELLVQLPAGSFPLDGAPATRAVPVEVEPFGTLVITASFYFPFPGEYAHTPGFVSARSETLASVDSKVLRVLGTLPAPPDTFLQLAARGSLEELLAHLESSPLESVPLSSLAWRMVERPAFDAILAVLRRRFVYDNTLWSYGIHHRDVAATREYLARQASLASSLRPWIESPLLSLHPVDDFAIETLEFAPLVNARAHANRRSRAIANVGAAQRYVDFLELLALRPEREPRDQLELSYHMLIQERVEEALAALSRVDRNQVAEKLQYDYLAAYLALTAGDTARARALCEPHREHPVLRWRKLFGAALEYLDRAEGKAVDAADGERPALPPPLALDLEVTGTSLRIQHRGARALTLAFTPVDLELNFSKSPFPGASGVGASGILPHRLLELEAAPEGATLDVPIPEDLLARPLVVELRAGASVRRALFQPTQLAVHFETQRGQLEARDRTSGAPLPGAYVKVYSDDGRGNVRFHRDGYTDLLGRFDYTSVSTQAPWPKRFAVLVLHDDKGALVREVASPTR